MEIFTQHLVQTTVDSVGASGGTIWKAQTFIPAYSGKLQQINLKLAVQNTLYRHDLIIGIRNTDGAGKPTGADLVTATYPTGGLGVGVGGLAEKAISLGVGCDVTLGTKYALVCRAPNADTGETVYIGMESPTGTYPSGNVLNSSDSGVSWGNQTWDYYFKAYGTNGGGEPLPDCAIVCLASNLGGYGVDSDGAWNNTWLGSTPTMYPYEAYQAVMCSLTASYWITRGMLTFDLSTQGAITVTNAKLRIYKHAEDYSINYQLWLVEGKHSPPLTIVDYQAYGVTQSAIGIKNLADFADGWNDITIEPSGYSLIENAVGGYLNLGMRLQPDAENSPPLSENNMTFRGAGYSGYEPLLLVNCVGGAKSRCFILS